MGENASICSWNAPGHSFKEGGFDKGKWLAS